MSVIRADVGSQWTNLRGWTTTELSFHGFANLSTTRDIYVDSPEFSCFGHQWSIRLFPGGRAESDEGFVAVDLLNRSNTGIKIQYGYGVRHPDGVEVVRCNKYTNDFAACGSQCSAYYYANVAPRSYLMELLVDGSLLIEVRMKSISIDKSIAQFIPTNPFNKNVSKLFNEEETADVVFELGGEQATGTITRKKSKTITYFHAHKLILKNNASALYEMCGVSNAEGITTLSITDVKPEIFEHMIYYTYGGKLSEEEMKNNTKDIIDACDKYGVVHLKLEAEACYVKSNTITTENMMNNLLYADSKNLALLKETVMDYIVANKDDIIGKVSFDSIPGFATDLLTAMSRGEQNENNINNKNYNRMRVGTLRKMLDEKGLDVDGSRESMIALLKEHSA